MRSYEWQSPAALQADVVAKAVAISGLFFAPAVWLIMLDYIVVGVLLILLAVIAAFIAVRTTKGTKIQIKGNTLSYGVSHKVDLSGLRGVRITKQFGIEEILILECDKGGSPIPIKGIPNNVRNEMLEVLRERINAC